MTTSTIEVPARYGGPPDTANGGYVAGLLGTPFGSSATVRLEAAVPRPLVAGETLTVVGRHLGTEGRKRFASTALYDDAGEAVAWSDTVWIALSSG